MNLEGSGDEPENEMDRDADMKQRTTSWSQRRSE